MEHDARLVHLATQRRAMIHAAVQENRVESVRILLEGGADANARDILGRTPLAVQFAVNKLGSALQFANEGVLSRHLGPRRFSPEGFEEIRRLLLQYGGQELDDYLYTVEQRHLIEAAAAYMRSLDGAPTMFRSNAHLESAKPAQDDPKGLENFMVGVAKSVFGPGCARDSFAQYLRSVQTLAAAAKDLPVGSCVCGLMFTSKFKEYLAPWEMPVDWDRFFDFMVAVLRFAENPEAYSSDIPPELEQDMERLMEMVDDEAVNVFITEAPFPDAGKRFFEHMLKMPFPDDFEAAMKCLNLRYIPELPQGVLLPEEAKEFFGRYADLQTSAMQPADFLGFYESVGQLLGLRDNLAVTNGGASSGDGHGLDPASDYQPTFLAHLEPRSSVWVCMPSAGHPLNRKAELLVRLVPLVLLFGAMLWRVICWLRWLTILRLGRVAALVAVHSATMKFPAILVDLPLFVLLAVIVGGLASDRVWQLLLELSFAQGSLQWTLYQDPQRSVRRLISFRWRYGFPEVEPVILSNVKGEAWEFSFADVLEAVHGDFKYLSNLSGWIYRADAVAAVLDEWSRDGVDGKEATEKHWQYGWWQYTTGAEGTEGSENKDKRANKTNEDNEDNKDNKNNKDNKDNSQGSEPKPGSWRKYNLNASLDVTGLFRGFDKIEVRVLL